MFRGEGVICGTSTTGTGTATLAATPAPPGGVDFYQWLTATSIGFVNGNAILVSYTIIEYTTSSFTTAHQMEKGVGTLTLGASLAATTLARTTVQVTATSLDSTATYNVKSPSAINIGTAANTLVFVGAAATDVLSVNPYFETTIVTTSNLGTPPLSVSQSGNPQISSDGSGKDWYWPIVLARPLLVKRVTVQVLTAYQGGTPVSTAFFRLYAFGTDGRPSKLLFNFGALGGANPLNVAGMIQSSLATDGIFLPPGEYIGNLFATFTGGTGGPTMFGTTAFLVTGSFGSGAVSLITMSLNIATGGSSTPSDPANVTGYTRSATGGTTPINLWLSPT